MAINPAFYTQIILIEGTEDGPSNQIPNTLLKDALASNQKEIFIPVLIDYLQGLLAGQNPVNTLMAVQTTYPCIENDPIAEQGTLTIEVGVLTAGDFVIVGGTQFIADTNFDIGADPTESAQNLVLAMESTSMPSFYLISRVDNVITLTLQNPFLGDFDTNLLVDKGGEFTLSGLFFEGGKGGPIRVFQF